MKNFSIFTILRDVITSYGGWSIGHEISKQLSLNDKKTFFVSFMAMTAAGKLGRVMDEKINKNINDGANHVEFHNQDLQRLDNDRDQSDFINRLKVEKANNMSLERQIGL